MNILFSVEEFEIFQMLASEFALSRFSDIRSGF